MRALFIQQDHVSPVGPVGERFSERGYEVHEFNVVPEHHFDAPGIDVAFPDPLDFDVIVPMGAPWSVYDEATIGAWVLEEVGLLRHAHEEGVPIFGICFGGQALATALGGSVQRSEVPEVGWHTIDSDEPELVESGPWFQWHHDRWVTPPQARLIASTVNAPQAFVQRRSMGLQFHPELVGSMLDLWLRNGGADYLTAHGFDPDHLVTSTAREESAAIERSRRLVDRFLDQVATAP